MNPRPEIRDIIRRIAMSVVPQLPRTSQINFMASMISRECDRSIAPGLVRDLWYALDDDERGVDSRHMDWARARSRTMSANDNFRASRPCSAEAVRAA